MYKILFFLLISIFNLEAQDKSDYNWLFSNESNSSIDGLEGNIVSFTNKERTIKENQIPIEFGGTNAIISDKGNGEILFYSAGCNIVNKNHEIMVNGEDLNQFNLENSLCSNADELLLSNSLLILDESSKAGIYYVLHQYTESSPSSGLGLQYSIVNMDKQNGLGEVILKNQPLIPWNSLKSSYLTAIRKEKNSGWWITCMDFSTNNIYLLELDSQGFASLDTISQDLPFNEKTSGSGQACFSPAGDKFAWFNPFDGVFVYDFDLGSGTTEFLWHQDIPFNPSVFYGEPVFSPSGQFLYLTSDLTVYQIDTWDVDPPSTIELIAEWDGFGDPNPVGFTSSLLAPDCKIYLASGAATRHLGVIHNPDERGTACNLIQHEVELAWHKNVGLMPNFPIFRNNEESPCDDQITNLNFVENDQVFKISIYPNPSDLEVVFSFPRPMSSVSKLSLFDVNGRLVKSESIKKHQLSKRISVDNFDSGIYFWKLVNDQGILSSGKLVKN